MLRRLLARVINELLQNESSSIERAQVIATLSNSIIKAMKVGELDERMKEFKRKWGCEEHMSIRQRLIKSERALPEKLKGREKKLDPIISWLVKNTEKFKECIKQLWRLSL